MIIIEENLPKKFPGKSSFFVSFNYNPKIVEILKKLDTRDYDVDTKQWETCVNDLAYLIENLSRFDDIKLKLLPDKKKAIEKEVTLDIKKYKTKPLSYQKQAIEFGLKNNKWLLLDAPGLGKTLTTLYIAQELKQREDIEHCLIICGVNTLKVNWKNEIKKHTKLSCRILGERTRKNGNTYFGGNKEKIEDLSKPINEFFVIVNIEALRSKEITKLINKGKNKFPMIICDEIHCLKSSSSQSGSNFLKLKSAKYKIGLTGTLLTNTPLDCYVPLKWVDSEKSNYKNFKNFYSQFGGPFNNMVIGFKNTNLLKDQLSEVSLRRTKDILDLPPKTIINEYVELEDSQHTFYNNIVKGIVDQVDKVNISTTSLLSMITRLRQATACPSILTTDESVKSSKLIRAIDIAEQIMSSNQKVVIFSTFKETCNVLKRELEKYNPVVCTGDVPDNIINNNINEFQNNDDCKVFIGTWQKCGTGITLTKSNYVIFIDCPWTNAIYEQAQDRCYRIGTKNPVTIYHLITKNTIDERVLEILNDKKAISDYIVDDQIPNSALQSLQKWILELKPL